MSINIEMAIRDKRITYGTWEPGAMKRSNATEGLFIKYFPKFDCGVCPCEKL